MVKYSEQDILSAYDEFNADKEWVSGNAHEIVAYDFLSRNQSLPEFFMERTIDPLHLYYCLNKISQAKTIEERISLIEAYCNENQIIFSQYSDLKTLYGLGVCTKKRVMTDTEYKRLIMGTDKEQCRRTIKDLARKLRLSSKTGARFGIMEYYAYFDIDLIDIMKYIDTLEAPHPDIALVRTFITSLDETHQLDRVEYSDIFTSSTPKKIINELCYNGEAFNEVVSTLLLTRYPILTGTLNYAYILREKGRLQSFSKQKVKTKFESVVERGNKNGRGNKNY